MVYSSTKLPEGIRKPINSFTRLTQKGNDYRAVLTAAAVAYRTPIGDLRALMDRLEIVYPSDLSGAVWEFINGVPRRPGQPYRPAAVKEHFDGKFFPTGMVNMVPLNAPGRRYRLR